MSTKFLTALLGIAVVGVLMGAAPASRSHRADGFALGEAGTAWDDERLLVAVPLENGSGLEAQDVRVTRATLQGRILVKPERLPLVLGDLPAEEDSVVQLAFREARPLRDREDARGNRRGDELVLHVEGTSRVAGHVRHFNALRRIALPPTLSGERRVRFVAVRPRRFDGGEFPPSNANLGPEDVNETEHPPLPKNGDPVNSPAANPPIDIVPHAAGTGPGAPPLGRALDEPITLVRAGSVVLGPSGIPWDPSGGSVDVPATANSLRVVLLSGNRYLLLSLDGGTTFPTVFDPATIAAGASFPADGLPPDLGLCCDQNVLYVPQINRFLWLMLTAGSVADYLPDENGQDDPEKPINAYNRLRLCSASPQEVAMSQAKSWTCWDMTTSSFGLTTGLPFMDHPDLTTTGSSANIGVTLADRGQYLVARVPLAQIQAGAGITIGHTDPQSSPFGQARLVHDAPDAAYWFGHGFVGEQSASLGVFEWVDGAGTYSWRYLQIPPWVAVDEKSATNVSITADGVNNWIQANTDSVRGGTVLPDAVIQGGPQNGQTARRILIAWNAAAGGDFTQPYVRLQTLLRTTGGTWIAGDAAQIWNPAFAFQHAHLGTNANGEAGVSVATGGGGNEATPVAGFIGDSALYLIGASTASICRWGDYTAIRRHWPNAKLFSVSDYYLQYAASATPVTFCLPDLAPSQPFVPIHQYRLFGRSADVDGTQ